jgi:RHS repeat-associated protein
VNRLASASESGDWSQTFSYDAFGNMWESTTGLPLNNTRPTSNVYTANNRMTTASYDAAGNQTTIPNLPGATQSYDAENRITQTIGSGTTTYTYDGDGKRVEKVGASGTTVYVYDAAGVLTAEYGTTGQSSPCTTCYLGTDHLGTTRIVMDAVGNVVSRHDFTPFGEEIPASTVGRDANFGSGNDNIAEKFTGKQRDTESGLDYFGARYFGSALGRFTSPDPITATPLHIINPQRWNMYAYGMNDPLAYTDPDGRDAIAVNFQKEVPGGGHEGIISVHADGRAEYARFGPRGGNTPLGEGKVDVQQLPEVSFGANGLPTDVAYKQLANEVANFEGQDPSSVRMNYFKTSDADTAALDAWIGRTKGASDQRCYVGYNVGSQNCATYTIVGLFVAHAIQNSHISLIPNSLFDLLSPLATENYSQGKRSDPEADRKKQHKDCLQNRDGTCVQ